MNATRFAIYEFLFSWRLQTAEYDWQRVSARSHTYTHRQLLRYNYTVKCSCGCEMGYSVPRSIRPGWRGFIVHNGSVRSTQFVKMTRWFRISSLLCWKMIKLSGQPWLGRINNAAAAKRANSVNSGGQMINYTTSAISSQIVKQWLGMLIVYVLIAIINMALTFGQENDWLAPPISGWSGGRKLESGGRRAEDHDQLGQHFLWQILFGPLPALNESTFSRQDVSFRPTLSFGI